MLEYLLYCILIRHLYSLKLSCNFKSLRTRTFNNSNLSLRSTLESIFSFLWLLWLNSLAPQGVLLNRFGRIRQKHFLQTLHLTSYIISCHSSLHFFRLATVIYLFNSFVKINSKIFCLNTTSVIRLVCVSYFLTSSLYSCPHLS